MVRFLRRGHSLDKNGSQSHDSHDSNLLHRTGSNNTAEMHESLANGAAGTPPLPNGRAAAAGARSRLARDGPPTGTYAINFFESKYPILRV